MDLVSLMDLTYTGLFQKIRGIEQDIIRDIELGKIDISEIPEIFVTQNIVLNFIVTAQGELSNIPLVKLDNIICLAACQLKNNNLLEIPQERTSWVSLNLKEPFLKLVSDQYKTAFVCEAFVKYDHENIRYVPDQLLNDRDYLKKLCLLNPKILSTLSFNSCDYELCHVAMDSPLFTLDCLPESWRTEEICHEAFDKNYKEILNFPSALINRSLIAKAIRLCSKGEVQNILKLLASDQYDNDLVVAAVLKDEAAFNLVPYDRITSEIVFNIAPHIHKYETLYHVPENIFNSNLNHRLISCNPMSLYAIPARFRTKSLCLEAVSANGMALGAVPSALKTDELYKTAITNNGLALKYVPTPYRDDEIPMMAVEQNGEAIEFVPESVVDEVICRKAVMQNPHAIYYIPKKMQSNELFLIALKQLPMVLKLIPVDSRTVEQCLMAIEKDKSLWDFVPIQLRENRRLIAKAEKLGLIEVESKEVNEVI